MRHFTITHPLADHAGVYLIRNLDTGHVYVGSTGRSFHVRWTAHIRDLRSGKNPCATLQEAWSQSTPDRFEFDVVEIVGPDEARIREQVAINRMRADGVTLYNINDACYDPLDVYTDDELFSALYHLLPEPV